MVTIHSPLVDDEFKGLPVLETNGDLKGCCLFVLPRGSCCRLEGFDFDKLYIWGSNKTNKADPMNALRLIV